MSDFDTRPYSSGSLRSPAVKLIMIYETSLISFRWVRALRFTPPGTASPRFWCKQRGKRDVSDMGLASIAGMRDTPIARF